MYNVFNYDTFDKLDIVYVIVMFIICCGPMYQIVFVITKLYNVENDVLSFLYQYPISKLTQIEAGEVLITINSFITHKPLIKASNMFTVGTPLLASISGMVITYLLVAIQFHVTLRNK
nr:uncharacterized protein LOC111423748 [Onthophagus taurus]